MAKKTSVSRYSGGTAVAEPEVHPARPAEAAREVEDEQRLSTRYGIDEENVRMRRKFIRLDEPQRKKLAELAPWMRSIAADVAREFYDWQFEFEATRRFFERHAKARKITLQELRRHLERAQTEYLAQVFEGIDGDFGLAYFERRLRVGVLHETISLPQKWVVGSYPEWQMLIAKHLREKIKDPAELEFTERAVSRVMNLDLQLFVDGFLLATFESMGFNVSAIESDGDRTDNLVGLRRSVETLIKQTEALAAGDLSNAAFASIGHGADYETAGVLARNMFDLVTTFRNFIADMKTMADEHNAGDIDVIIPADKFEGAYADMAEGVNEMVGAHISVKKKAMAVVAEFGRGNFDAPMEQLPGKKAFINDVIETVRGNLKRLMTDVEMLSGAASQGRLNASADATKHHGGYRTIVETINGTMQMVVEPIRAVSENAGVLASASEELTAVSQQMAGTAEETAVQASAVSAASTQVNDNIAVVASAAEEMRASIAEIATNANNAARVAKSAVTVAATTNQTVQKLGESGHQIGNVIKVITSIAQQTNLLALNATIEAARAGEAGKGFAVVANEVKELAKQTAKATEEISQKIEAIQGDSKGTLDAIGQIAAIINEIDGIFNTIACSVEEQKATTSEISHRVNEAAQGSSDIAKNIAGVAEAAKHTTQGAMDTQISSKQLSKMAAELQTIVSRYTF